MKSKLKPVSKEMKRFKMYFHSKDHACFQTIAKSAMATGKPTTFYSSFSGAQEQLVSANVSHMEIAMLINKGDDEGRKAANIKKINALFADFDSGGMSKAQLMKLPIPPHLIVETSPGKFHTYWLVIGCGVQQFKSIQSALAKKLGCDSSVVDASRVMRMPGTINWKYDEPFLARIVHIDEDIERIHIDYFVARMDLKVELSESVENMISTTDTKSTNRKPMSIVKVQKIQAALNGLAADDRTLWLHVGMAIHSADSSEVGYKLWDTWSSKSAKFDEKDQRKTWAAFKQDGAINLRTLYWLAKHHKDSASIVYDEMILADMLAASCSDILRYDRDNRTWFHFSGVVWESDNQAPYRLVRGFIKSLTQGDVANNELKRFRNTAGQRAVVAQSEMLDEFKITAQDFDKNSNLFTVKNGVIDLMSGEFRLAKAADYLYRQSEVAYDASAKCHEWIKFMRSVVKGDQELHKFLRRALGYSMFGHAQMQLFFVLIGSGGNGKGVLMRTIKKLFGEYGLTVAPNLLTNAYSGNANSPSPAMATLLGARMVICTELSTGRKFDEAFIKQYAGGDEITARSSYGPQFTFKPEGKLFLSTNEMPEIQASDEAMWRRIKPIPFLAKFRGHEVDEKLEQKLEDEYSGILNWLLIGAKDFSENGIGSCDAVDDMYRHMRKESDSVLAWLSDCCIKNANAETQASNAYKSYATYMNQSKRRALSTSKFLKSLLDKGFVHKSKRQHNLYVGFSLRA